MLSRGHNRGWYLLDEWMKRWLHFTFPPITDRADDHRQTLI
jgi:hypothetical protein